MEHAFDSKLSYLINNFDIVKSRVLRDLICWFTIPHRPTSLHGLICRIPTGVCLKSRAKETLATDWRTRTHARTCGKVYIGCVTH